MPEPQFDGAIRERGLLRGPGIRMRLCDGLAKIVVRARRDDDAVRAAFDTTFGSVAPAPLRAVATPLGNLLWIGPSEWMLVTTAGPPEGLLRRLQGEFAECGAAVVDMSSARQIIRLAGASAHRLLARECDLDLNVSRFDAGYCAATRLGPFSVLVHRPDAEPAYDVYLPRSYAASAWRWLATLAAELPAVPTPETDACQAGEPAPDLPAGSESGASPNG